MMRRVTPIALVCALMLALASLAAAQGTLQVPSGAAVPAVRLGNFIEIGNDVFMHIIATTDFRYNTTTNFDFESQVRDRVGSRNPESSVEQGGESDLFWMLARFGVDFRYQKSTEVQLVLEQRTNLDGNTTDDRFNSTTPVARISLAALLPRKTRASSACSAGWTISSRARPCASAWAMTCGRLIRPA